MLLSISSHAYEHISLIKALKSKKVSINATSTDGGYKGKGIELSLTNHTSRSLYIYVDPGMTFVPKDGRYQNLVLLGDEQIVLKGRAQKNFKFQTFCGKSYARAPGQGLIYNYWKQGDSAMIDVLTYARRKAVGKGLIQSAVWMFTNNHRVHNVYSYSNPDQSRKFVKYICKRTNREMPDFHVRRQIRGCMVGQPVYPPGPDTTYVDMHWKVSPRRNTHISIYDGTGGLIKEVTDNELITSQGHTVRVTFLPNEYADGTYYVKMHDDENQVYITKKVTIVNQT